MARTSMTRNLSNNSWRTWLATVSASAALVAMASCATTQTPSSSSDSAVSAASSRPLATALTYPAARTVDHVDDYNGVKVADPYRWMEDLESNEIAQWVKAENDITFPFLRSIPQRTSIESRLTRMWNYERFGTPFKEGGRYFYTRNDGLQNQSVLYVAESLDAKPRMLLDPNTLSADGTVSLGGYSISDDGRFIAYATSDGGSDWRTWHVRSVDTSKDLPDIINWSKFSGASWAPDGSGFYYSRYDEPKDVNALAGANYNQKVFFHRIGDAQDQDSLIYERPDHPDWGFGAGVTDDGAYLIIRASQGTDRRNRVFYKDLRSGSGEVVELLTDFDASYGFIDNDGPIFWFQTDLDAPRSRVIAIDTRIPARDSWLELVPESRDTLRSVNAVGGRFVATYLHDARTLVRMFSLDGRAMGEIALPGIGSAGGFGGKRNYKETFYSFSSYATPPTIYRYDFTTGASEVFRKADVAFDPNNYVTQQVFYASKDGTRVPMFITHKKGLKRNGNNPTLLYAYGGFNIPMTPRFSVSNLVWMEMGGIYAVANLRGGGEYGEDWHQQGMKHNKQNVFDDFIAAAQFLIDNRYTSTPKLAVQGGSNGGLLIGAVMTQRPDLFGACLPAVGVMDMLRFNKFTIGWAWESDYGSPQDPDDFAALRAYSPYQNIKDGVCYPPTLITTADHDDRVVPAHSFKFAARMQAAQSCENPILIRVETRAGHGAGTPTSKRIEQAADQWAFLTWALDIDNGAPGGTGAMGGAAGR